MPGFNRKGPDGEGPMTGRKMGRCTNFGEALKATDTNNTEPEDDSGEGFGRGLGRGRGRGPGIGRGRGFRRGFGNQNRFRGGE